MVAAAEFLPRLARFGRALRRQGVRTTFGQVMDLARALEHLDIGDRAQFRGAARAILVTRKEDLPIFDQVFAQFWRARYQWLDTLIDGQPRPESAPTDPEEHEAHERERSLHAGGDGRELQILGESQDGAVEAEEDDDPLPLPSRASAVEVLRTRDFAELTADEVAEVRRLMAGLQWRLGERRSRRQAPAHKGCTIDPRRTLRRSLATGGVPLRLLRRQTRTRPRQLVVICDVSGSMERYSRLLLHFLYAVENGLARVEAFVFGTRLTRITRLLRRRSLEEAMDRVASTVHDWAGGTRIGESLQAFNLHWARRVLRNGAVVLIISDGWDRGDPELLRREMARLQRSSYRLIWLNPLLGGAGYQPLTRGIQAALPYVDDFLPVHNLASLEALAERLRTIDERRPVRRQRGAQDARYSSPDRAVAP